MVAGAPGGGVVILTGNNRVLQALSSVAREAAYRRSRHARRHRERLLRRVVIEARRGACNPVNQRGGRAAGICGVGSAHRSRVTS